MYFLCIYRVYYLRIGILEGNALGASVAIAIANGPHWTRIPIRTLKGAITGGAEAVSIRGAIVLLTIKDGIMPSKRESGIHRGRDEEMSACILTAGYANAMFTFVTVTGSAVLETAAFSVGKGESTRIKEGSGGITHGIVGGLHAGSGSHTNGYNGLDGLEISIFKGTAHVKTAFV